MSYSQEAYIDSLERKIKELEEKPSNNFYFKIVSRHSNMSHDGDLFRSGLYRTTADEETVGMVIKLAKQDLESSFSEIVEKTINSLVCLGFNVEEVKCDKAFDVSM